MKRECQNYGIKLVGINVVWHTCNSYAYSIDTKAVVLETYNYRIKNYEVEMLLGIKVTLVHLPHV